jgi:hypothetical protein
MAEDKYYDITLRDVKQTMNNENSKNRKASDLDSIMNEMLKCRGPNIQREIATLFRKIRNTGRVSQEYITISI